MLMDNVQSLGVLNVWFSTAIVMCPLYKGFQDSASFTIKFLFLISMSRDWSNLGC